MSLMSSMIIDVPIIGPKIIDFAAPSVGKAFWRWHLPQIEPENAKKLLF